MASILNTGLRFQTLCLGLLATLAGSITPAHAEMSDWAVNDGGRMRIVALPPEPDGTVRGALQIEPREGWITYWKQPGQAGIPPQLSLAPDSGLTLTDMKFPVPKQFVDGDIRDLGYDHPVTLPFTVKITDASRPAVFKASAFIGLCRNICVPFQAEFQVNLLSKKLPLEENLILDEATRHLPEAPSRDFAVAESKLGSDHKKLKLALKLPEGSPRPDIVVVGPDGHVLLDQEHAKNSGGIYSVDMPLGKLANKPMQPGTDWSLLVIAGNRAMETPLAIE